MKFEAFELKKMLKKHNLPVTTINITKFAYLSVL